jgi:hypothetical protein
MRLLPAPFRSCRATNLRDISPAPCSGAHGRTTMGNSGGGNRYCYEIKGYSVPLPGFRKPPRIGDRKLNRIKGRNSLKPGFRKGDRMVATYSSVIRWCTRECSHSRGRRSCRYSLPSGSGSAIASLRTRFTICRRAVWKKHSSPNGHSASLAG